MSANPSAQGERTRTREDDGSHSYFYRRKEKRPRIDDLGSPSVTPKTGKADPKGAAEAQVPPTVPPKSVQCTALARAPTDPDPESLSIPFTLASLPPTPEMSLPPLAQPIMTTPPPVASQSWSSPVAPTQPIPGSQSAAHGPCTHTDPDHPDACYCALLDEINGRGSVTACSELRARCSALHPGKVSKEAASTILRRAIMRGRVELCKWVQATYPLDAETIRAGHNFTLRLAFRAEEIVFVERGHYDATAEWLINTFRLTPEDRRQAQDLVDYLSI